MRKGIRCFAMAFVGPFAVAAVATPARAGEAKRVVFVASGPDGDGIARALGSRLPPSYVADDARPFRAALSRGAPTALAAALRSPHAESQLVAKARSAADGAHADVAVLLVVRPTKQARVVHVWVVDPHDEKPLVDEDVSLSRPARPADMADATWSAIASAFPAALPEAANAPAPEASARAAGPTPAASTPPAIAPPVVPEAARSGSPEQSADATPGGGETSAEGGGDAPALFRVGAALQGGSRHFSYVDRLSPTLRPYDLWVAPLIGVEGEIDPLARSPSPSPWLRRLGLGADYARAFALSSADQAGTHVSTTWQSFHVDLRERVAIRPSTLLGGHVGYGGIDFSLDGQVDATSRLPSVAYRFVRVGADARARVAAFLLYADASYLAVQSTGPMGGMFPRESVGGVEAHAGVTRALRPSLEATVELAYTRFFYSFRPQPGDAYVAGGGLDQLVAASAGVAYRY